jgi:hypothetical protein
MTTPEEKALAAVLDKLRAVEQSPGGAHVFDSKEVKGIHTLLSYRPELEQVAQRRRRWNAVKSFGGEGVAGIKWLLGAIAVLLAFNSQALEAVKLWLGIAP